MSKMTRQCADILGRKVYLQTCFKTGNVDAEVMC